VNLTDAPTEVLDQLKAFSPQQNRQHQLVNMRCLKLKELLHKMDMGSCLESIELYLPQPSQKHKVLELFQTGVTNKKIRTTKHALCAYPCMHWTPGIPKCMIFYLNQVVQSRSCSRVHASG